MTMSTTASALARAFGIVVRTIADLLSLLQDYGPLTPPLSRMLDISYNEAIRYGIFLEKLTFWNPAVLFCYVKLWQHPDNEPILKF